MASLTENLTEIKRQKDTYILPENLKKGVTAFGITGTLQYMVKTFATMEEMNNAASTLPEDTIGVVYGITYGGTYRLDNGSWTQIGDSTDEQKIMNVLNEIDSKGDQYEDVGGTDEEINAVLDNIIGGNV